MADVNLAGLIDMHVHTAPDVVPRFADDLDTAGAAAAAGMRAILIKSHVTLTADRATMAEKARGGLHVFGGLALNEAVGGLNPRAVEVALRLGAREIWLPTFDAANYRRWERQPGGIGVLGEDGRLLPVVYDILDLIRAGEVILGTGHLSVAETAAVVRAARERGPHKILITHPEAPFVAMSPTAQEELRGPGVFFERCAIFALPAVGAALGLAGIAAQIRRVGVESTVLATDLGQATNPSPADGLRRYLAGLLAEGFCEREIRRMAGENPAYLLGLER